jgi:hypothetical protein
VRLKKPRECGAFFVSAFIQKIPSEKTPFEKGGLGGFKAARIVD